MTFDTSTTTRSAAVAVAQRASRHGARALLCLALWPLAIYGAVGDSAEQDEAPSRPRSVLFYLMDTCRQDRTAMDGYERKTTPFLEWLAERSVVFENCYSQASWTKPAMASMLTSQYPSTAGVQRMEQKLPAKALTWPEVLQAQGMHTAGFSANINMGNLLSNFAQGFDHFVESTDINNGDPIHFASGSAKRLNEHAFDWLGRTQLWPMLLYMHSVDPHEEYEPNAQYLEKFADPTRHGRFREEWELLLKSRPPIPGLYVTQDNFDRTAVDSSSFIEHASNLYDGDILANDAQMQRLWDKLQDDGWGDDFILVFTSDHGEEFFDHGGTSHGNSLYEEMLRVPLMIYAPGLAPGGKRIDTPVRSLDIFPTLCDLLGFDVPPGLQGQSLVPLMNGEGRGSARDVFAEHSEDPVLRSLGLGSGVMVSVRNGQWKLISNVQSPQLIERPRYELFDLNADPHEQRNVAEAHPELVQQMQAKVEHFIAEFQQGKAAESEEIMDPEVLAQLRALGYIGEEADLPSLWEAMESKDPVQIRQALQGGADANELEPVSGMSPLAMAAIFGSIDLAKLLLAAGADVNLPNRDGATALHSAAFLGEAQMLDFLLEQGANPAATSAMGGTVLSSTEVPWDFTVFVASLFQMELDQQSVEEGRRLCAEKLAAIQGAADTPLSHLLGAIRDGNLDDARGALTRGANLKAWDAETGLTPLSLAAFLGRHKIAGLLIEQGASVLARDRNMSTTLHSAAAAGHESLVELLLEHGADVDTQDGRGASPLHVAAFLGRVEPARTLLAHGADTALKDEDGQTARDVTQTTWPITEFVMGLLGFALEQEQVESGRAKVVALLDGET